MNRCEQFARTVAKLAGLTYSKATKLYPRGFNYKSVYLDGVKVHEGHCVHCARAEAIIKGGKNEV